VLLQVEIAGLRQGKFRLRLTTRRVVKAEMVPRKCLSMLAKSVLNMRDNLQNQGVVFAYCGYINETILTGLGEALRRKLSHDEPDVTKLRSAFSVFVEQMQNIIRHSSEMIEADTPDVEPLRYGMLSIGKSGDDYFVISGNKVARTAAPQLREHLEEIHAMDLAAIKKAYRKQLLADDDRLSMGAGIGFLEVARRASRAIEFDFEELEDGSTFFAFKVTV
jgi:hypothetical protein